MEYRDPIEDSLAARLINRLRLKHWSLLSALSETATLHQAAMQINVSQPSATKMLHDIESAFGFSLFERGPRGVVSTPLGEEVVRYARQSRASLMNFLAALDNKQRGGHGRLVIGAIMGAAPDLVARSVARIKSERPLLDLVILGETSDQIGPLLEQHRIELAVGRFSEPLQHNAFDFLPLANETLQVVVRRGHPLTRRQTISLKTLQPWPWILQPLTSPARRLLEDAFSEAQLSSPVNIVECTSVFATLQLIQTSDAVAVLPESVVRDHVQVKLLHALPIQLGETLKGFGVLTRRGEILSEVAERFVSYLSEYARSGAPGKPKQRAPRPARERIKTRHSGTRSQGPR